MKPSDTIRALVTTITKSVDNPSHGLGVLLDLVDGIAAPEMERSVAGSDAAAASKAKLAVKASKRPSKK